MISFVPFDPAHLAALELQAAQNDLQRALEDPEIARAVTAGGLAETALLDGRPVGCAGVIGQWRTEAGGRAIAWALVGRIPAAAWVAVTRQARAGLDRAHAAGYRRIETTVLAGFRNGHRWARALGFAPEVKMAAYGPGGEDHWLYARIAT